MTTPKTKYPIESFGPELMAALLRGGRERVVIPFAEGDGAGKRKAHSFQRRIHTLRQRMRMEHHPSFMIAARARVSLFWGEKAVNNGAPASWASDPDGRLGALIVIAPQDSEFTEILHRAGIDPKSIEEALLPPPVLPTLSPPNPEEGTIEGLLEKLWGSKSTEAEK